MDTPVVVTVGTDTLTTADLLVNLIISLKVSFYVTVNTLGYVIRVFKKIVSGDQILGGMTPIDWQ